MEEGLAGRGAVSGSLAGATLRCGSGEGLGLGEGAFVGFHI